MGWFVPAMMAASTAVTLMGRNQQKKNMRADAAWKKYENEINYHIQKQKELSDQTKLLSEQRASGAAGGSQFSGSLLLASATDQEEFEYDMMLLAKGFALNNGATDSLLQGQIASTNLAMLGDVAGGAASIGGYNQQQKFLDAKFGKKDSA
tara:strand:+ start:1325 stop:1777 length:453 start_codon:yes stop_codon:yes gene_type:complete